jgi:hypothetical protein
MERALCGSSPEPGAQNAEWKILLLVRLGLAAIW